jgi:hypothetical protein
VKKALDKVSGLFFKDRIFWHWSKTCRLLKRALIDNVELEIATLLSGDKTEE